MSLRSFSDTFPFFSCRILWCKPFDSFLFTTLRWFSCERKYKNSCLKLLLELWSIWSLWLGTFSTLFSLSQFCHSEPSYNSLSSPSSKIWRISSCSSWSSDSIPTLFNFNLGPSYMFNDITAHLGLLTTIFGFNFGKLTIYETCLNFSSSDYISNSYGFLEPMGNFLMIPILSEDRLWFKSYFFSSTTSFYSSIWYGYAYAYGCAYTYTNGACTCGWGCKFCY